MKRLSFINAILILCLYLSCESDIEFDKSDRSSSYFWNTEWSGTGEELVTLNINGIIDTLLIDTPSVTFDFFQLRGEGVLYSSNRSPRNILWTYRAMDNSLNIGFEQNSSTITAPVYQYYEFDFIDCQQNAEFSIQSRISEMNGDTTKELKLTYELRREI